MKKIILTFVIFVILLPNIVMAQLSPSQARWNIAKKAGGCGAGIVVHELGHKIASDALGVDMKWNGLKWDASNARASQLRKISISGLASQMLSSEVILRSNAISDNNSFFLCWVGYNVFRQITYPLQYELSSGGHNDLATYKQYGGKVEYLEVGLILHALWTGYRVYHNPKTPIFFNATGNEMRVGFNINF